MGLKVVFMGEIKEVKKTKSVSNDEQYRIVLLSNDPSTKALIDFKADCNYSFGIVEEE